MLKGTQADFINVVVFRRQAENVNNYLFKGSLAGVDGRIQSRSYENQEGRRIFVTEVVADSVQFLEPKMLKVANVIKVITMISRLRSRIWWSTIRTKYILQ